MKKLISTLVIVTLIAACKVRTVNADCKETKDGSAACNRIYQPVCGCNGKRIATIV